MTVLFKVTVLFMLLLSDSDNAVHSDSADHVVAE